MPPDPLEQFWYLNLLQINSCRKNTLKNVKICCLPPNIHPSITASPQQNIFDPLLASLRTKELDTIRDFFVEIGLEDISLFRDDSSHWSAAANLKSK